MSGRALLIAYHFPPFQGSSGVHRTLAFARYLGDFGWRVSVLTVHPRTYLNFRPENSELIPSDIRVHRAWAFDAQRDLSIGGRYFRTLELPDRWQSWIVSGAVAGLAAVRNDKIDAIFSTYPIASAHAIGWCINRVTKLPWIADFRDPMAQPNYPSDPLVRRSLHRIERAVSRHAAAVTVTTPTTRSNFTVKYPDYAPSRVHVIANGYDEETFRGLQSQPAASVRHGPMVLLHSGILYPMERNPRCLFAALSELKSAGIVDAQRLRIRLRASGSEDVYRADAARAGIADMVELEPAIDYRAAIEEMWRADGLIACQSQICNEQIPAKVYEYLYVRKPVLGLADPAGDTGRLLREVGYTHVAALEDTVSIKRVLVDFIDSVARGLAPVPSTSKVLQYSRREGARALAALLDQVTAGGTRD